LDYNIKKDKITEQVEEQSDSFVSENEKNEQKIRIEILTHALNTANRIINFNEEHEKKKSFWRGFFIIFLCIILVSSLALAGIFLYIEKLSDFQLSILSGSILAEIFAMIFFMVKYVHNDLYLDTFTTVTQKLLDYLIQDKSPKEDNKDNKKENSDKK